MICLRFALRATIRNYHRFPSPHIEIADSRRDLYLLPILNLRPDVGTLIILTCILLAFRHSNQLCHDLRYVGALWSLDSFHFYFHLASLYINSEVGLRHNLVLLLGSITNLDLYYPTFDSAVNGPAQSNSNFFDNSLVIGGAKLSNELAI